MLIADAGSVAAGFLFGLFAGLGWFWWPVVCLLLFFEGLGAARCHSERQYGGVTFLAVVILATLHLFGVVDVLGLATQHGFSVLYWILGSLAFGFCIYSPARGWITTYRKRNEYAERLRDSKETFLNAKRRERSDAEDAPFNPADYEQEWQTKVKPVEWKRITDVERDFGFVVYMTIFWPIDLAWELVFKWFERLEDVMRFIWHRVRGVAQAIKNSALRGVDRNI